LRTISTKEVLLASDRDVFFTEPHYQGYPAVLVRLPKIDRAHLKEVLTNAWRCRAYVAGRGFDGLR